VGDQLGPRANAGYLTLDRDEARLGMFSFEGALEVRSGNVYTTAFSNAAAAGFHFVLVERHPAEKRVRGVVAWRTPRDTRFGLRAAAGIERVRNFGFVGGVTKLNGIAQLGVEVRP